MSERLGTLAKRIGQAAYTAAAVEGASRALSVILSIAVARALEPREVGVLGLAVIVVGALSQIAFYVETACITSRSSGSESAYASAAVVVRGVATAVLASMVLLSLDELAGLLSAGGADSELESLSRLLLWQLVLEVAGTYPRVLLQWRLRLMPLVVGNLVGVGCHVCLSVILLALGYGAKGVVWASLAGVGVTGGILWASLDRQSWPKVGGIESALWRQILPATGKVFLGGFPGYVGGRIDNVLVAGSLGPAAMSFYGMAWSASRMPVSVLYQAVGVVLIPAVAHMRDDSESLGLIVSRSIRHCYLLLLPVCTFLFVSGPALVTCVLGVKWLPLVPCLRIMAVTILVAPVLAVSNALLLGSGRQHLPGLGSTVHLLVLVALMVPLARWGGIVGAAVADLACAIALTAIQYVVCRLTLSGVPFGLSRAVLLPIVAAAVAGVSAWRVGMEFSYGGGRLASEALMIGLVYGAMTILLVGPGRLTGLAMMLRATARVVPEVSGSPPNRT